MAITTLDGCIAGMQPPEDYAKVGAGALVVGRCYSPFYVGSRPGAAAANSAGVNGLALTTYAGQIPFANGAAAQYLARFSAMSSQIGTLVLCDRLWHNSGLSVTLTTSQAITSTAWPARDKAASVNGAGIRVGLEVSTIMGAGVPGVVTLGYTNELGTAGKTANPRVTPIAASPVGTFYDFGLAAGDQGVRSIQTFQSAATWTSGAFHLVAYRELARIGVPAVSAEFALDALTSGFPNLHDNTVPFLLWIPGATTAPNLQGSVIYSHG